MRKRMLFIVPVFLLMAVTPSFAALLSFSDITTEPGFNISYSLSLNPIVGQTNKYKAVFSIYDASSVPSPTWYAGTFQFKFTSSSNGDISGAGMPTGNWNIADYDTNNSMKTIQGGGPLPANYNPLLETNRVGFYVKGVAEGNPVDVAQGVKVTNGDPSIISTFSFDLNTFGQSIFALDIPFQVDYYYTETEASGKSSSPKTKIYYGRLSKDLITRVPEPGTMVLLGSGLLGLAGWGRKSFRK